MISFLSMHSVRVFRTLKSQNNGFNILAMKICALLKKKTQNVSIYIQGKLIYNEYFVYNIYK